MKPKILVTNVLLLFVAASLVVLAAKSVQTVEPHQRTITDGVIAYYFHGKTRCPTCRSIEAYAKEAVHSGFPEQLQDGRLHWQIVNYELPQYEHLAQQYELIAACVVLVEVSGGEEIQWKNLPRVWELVHDDKQGFLDYVQEETRAMLSQPNS